MPRRHALRSFVQTVVLADGSALRRPEFLNKNQPRVLLIKQDQRPQQEALRQQHLDRQAKHRAAQAKQAAKQQA